MKYSEEFDTIVGYARDEALRTGSVSVGTDHLVLGILRHADNNACKALQGLGVKLEEMKKCIEAPVFHENGLPFSAAEKIELSPKAMETIAASVYEARTGGCTEAMAVHLLLAAANSDGCSTRTYLNTLGITRLAIEEYLKLHEMTGAPSKRKLHKFTFMIPAGGNGYKS